MIKKERLIEFCKRNHLWISGRNPSIRELQALIARWVLNGESIDRKSCFGLIDPEDNNCISCDLKSSCFKLSFGIDEESYWKRIDKADKIKFE